MISMTTSAKDVKPRAKVELLSEEIKTDMKAKGTWKPECPVPLERLRRVTFPYVDFEGNHHTDGEVIVMDAVADYVAEIFQELYVRKFPISCAKRVEHYDGDDNKSMADNSVSAFNYRVIEGTSTVSIHGYGLAIDLNPEQNPYVGHSRKDPDKDCMLFEVWPLNGAKYMNRHNQRPGMVEPIVELFAKHGFRIWGGTWNDMQDYHHFQTPRWLAEILAREPADKAKEIFNIYVKHPKIETLEDLQKHFKG